MLTCPTGLPTDGIMLDVEIALPMVLPLPDDIYLLHDIG